MTGFTNMENYVMQGIMLVQFIQMEISVIVLQLINLLEIMKIKYDPKVDALYIALADGSVTDSEQVNPGVIVHYDGADNVVGVEVLHVKKRVPPVNLGQIQLELGGTA